jgi:hypothetical protein
MKNGGSTVFEKGIDDERSDALGRLWENSPEFTREQRQFRTHLRGSVEFHINKASPAFS